MKNEGMNMEKMEKAMRMLRRVQSDLDMAHCEACAALGMFKAIDADKSLEADVRLAAVSLRNETLELCGKIIEAMNAVPAIAGNKGLTINDERLALRPKHSELPPLRTAASMLMNFRESKVKGLKSKASVVATSARYGRPICAGIH